MKKLHRAQEALSQTSDSTLVKTLSASFGTKWPYKRTMSAPASILSRQDSKLGKYVEKIFVCAYKIISLYFVILMNAIFDYLEKDKVYNRQFSAPVLKRKSSKFGLGN